MNSLVALGCSASFSVGIGSALWPGGAPLGGFDASFLEEPVMLLAFVLLGRTMEARAKVPYAAVALAIFRLSHSYSVLMQITTRIQHNCIKCKIIAVPMGLPPPHECR